MRHLNKIYQARSKTVNDIRRMTPLEHKDRRLGIQFFNNEKIGDLSDRFFENVTIIASAR